ncbi:UDP-N-acetylmuramoyl-tripeptide--D-alanyl-D-alanine ligase [Aggregatilinea lenta]|uniref:UDP-N-acetylmuramoyl-tripeptide--D-alanyl-D- alanine ligase n=1 Tax=Aggregatilinea lenta TaxID=913108 RepID=UPI000E5AC703|nr:UDP-N-acetylmuramoyl-tripeptide--D-alanyl-D-alanine ligase [Aggregatilinea lenta]
MDPILILVLIWLVGILLRIWRLARFFQLEGYMTSRYLRWLVAKPHRYILSRSAIFVGVAMLAALVLDFSGQDREGIYLLVWGATSILGIWPEPVKEVKQKLALTQRAVRLLATAFVVGIVVLLVAVVIAQASTSLSQAADYGLVVAVGLVVYHLCPLALPLANQIMYPVESSLRRVFRERARRTLQRANPTVIGITGSYGKTSTKEFIAHILNGRYRALPTPKSYNTLMGVCIVINNELAKGEPYDYFIVEMGAYIEGEIKAICDLTRPKISLVTAVGPQHLERFGSIESTARAKYEIIQALPPDGVGVFNWDDPLVRSMYERGYPDTRIGVTWQNAGHATHIRVQASNIRESADGLAFDVLDTLMDEQRPFHTKLVGRHNVTNILMATAVALHLDMSLGEIAMRVATLDSPEHRLQRRTLPGGMTVIDDAYSANPVGARGALDVLALYDDGRRVLITPGMVELGELQAQENQKLGRYAAGIATDIVLVGIEQTEPIQRGVLEAGFDTEHLHIFDTREEAIAWFQHELAAGDAVLFLNDLPDTYL